VGIVTCSKCRELTVSEKPLIPLLAALSLEASPVVWNDKDTDWTGFDALLIRSIWDYHLYPEEFLTWLKKIESFGIPVWNQPNVLRWNCHKFYLRYLAGQGVNVVPSLFLRRGTTDALAQALACGWSDVVVKPAVSASSYRTHAFSLANPEADSLLAEAASHGDFLVQPLLTSIREHGELSLIFIDNEFSHAVLKKPGANEFRVQNEFGGQAIAHQASQEIVQAARKVLAATGMELLYARIDGVAGKGGFVLMELELIEPDLFLNLCPGSDKLFAERIARRLTPSAS